MQAVLPKVSLAAAQRLVAAGAKLPGGKYRLPPESVEASAKKKWLESQGVEGKRLSPAKLLDQPYPDAAEVEATLRERDGLFGLIPGMSKADAMATGLGKADRVDLDFEGGDLARIAFRYSEQGDTAHRVGEAIAKVFTERWGEPVGEDTRRWRADGTLYTVRARLGAEDSSVEVTAERGVLEQGKRPDDIDAMLQA